MLIGGVAVVIVGVVVLVVGAVFVVVVVVGKSRIKRLYSEILRSSMMIKLQIESYLISHTIV